MDTLRQPAGVATTPQVHDRRAGGRPRREQAEAFRQALAEQEDAPTPAQSMTRTLQPTGRAGRRDQSAARHVDVVA